MPPQQYGIKIAQPGFDVRTCKDYELIFNSSWPTLSIVFDKTTSITTDSLGNAKIPHNLGFVPLSMAWRFTDSTMTISAGRFFPSVDLNNLYFGGLGANTTYYFNVKCYNLDITKPQNYLYLQPPAVNEPYDTTYGIKVSKQGQAITSTDQRSFILHSRSAGPQVLAVVTKVTTDPFGQQALIYQNPQGYTPWVFGYAYLNNPSFGNIYQWAPPVSQSYPKLNINVDGPNTSSIVITPVNGVYLGSLIVLRDPLFVPNTLSVVY